MTEELHPEVAILMATHNGARYVGAQIESLKDNMTAFTLHWLDDQSTDETRSLVREAASANGIKVCEWHQEKRLGASSSHFKLIELVAADIYMFCDQDDLWQPRKIDAMVKSILPQIHLPLLFFSDPLVFNDEQVTKVRYQSEAQYGGRDTLRSLESHPPFVHPGAPSHTQGFTRALRSIFLRHAAIADKYAAGYDCWMYTIAAAIGAARLLEDVPTSLYRQHQDSALGMLSQEFGSEGVLKRWRLARFLRTLLHRHAHGFLLSIDTLPQSEHLARFRELAKLIERLGHRQSPLIVVHIIMKRALYLPLNSAFWLAASCIISDADFADEGMSARKFT